MKERDRIRLVKLEDEIAATEDALRQELEYEQSSGRTTLLVSRIHARKLEALYKRKANFDRVIRMRREKKKMYDVILKERMEAVEIARNAISDVEHTRTQLLATYAITKSPTFWDDLKTYDKTLRSKKVILAAKERALNNWLERSEAITPIRKIADTTEGIQVNTPATTIKVATKNPMENDPKWNVKPTNNASIDILMRPEEVNNNVSDTSEYDAMKAAQNANPMFDDSGIMNNKPKEH